MENLGRSLEHQARHQRTPISFAALATEYITINSEERWRSASHIGAIKMLLLKYAASLANKFVDEITADDVEAAVRKAPQRKRTLRAIWQVFNLAISKGRCMSNPADARIMKCRFPVSRNGTRHHKAADYTEVPVVMQRLELQKRARSAPVIMFLILTACRASEVCKMRWEEINWETKTWTIPGSRTKMGHNHRVPLSEPALELLRQRIRQPGPGYVWCNRRGKPIGSKAIYLYLTRYMKVDATIHGFRATFSSWCYDKMDFPAELVEKCLAHYPGEVVGAYRRTDALERRREIMEKWAAFCCKS
jgi:integrase